MTHFITRDDLWRNGSNIGHDNANAVVMFRRNNGGRQPASPEEAFRFKEDRIGKPGNHGCGLIRPAQ